MWQLFVLTLLLLALPAWGAGDMVEVSAGDFYYECSNLVDEYGPCNDDEWPGHRIPLAAFKIDKREVTVSAYRECVRTGACTEPDTGEYCHWETRLEKRPINCVDWHQAKAYCSWAGKSLPTEQEWERAVCGPHCSKHPAGRLDSGEAWCSSWIEGGGRGWCLSSIWTMGSKPSEASAYRPGTTWEWTSSRKEEFRTLRGGPSSLDDLGVVESDWLPGVVGGARGKVTIVYGSRRRFVHPESRDANYVFRCAK